MKNLTEHGKYRLLVSKALQYVLQDTAERSIQLERMQMF